MVASWIDANTSLATLPWERRFLSGVLVSGIHTAALSVAPVAIDQGPKRRYACGSTPWVIVRRGLRWSAN